MKFYSFLSLAVFSSLLTACSSSTFKAKDLKPEIYNGYWAMYPVEHQYRVLKFNKNGSVKIYDYQCHSDGSYSLNETETVYLVPLKEDQFNLLDSQKKPFAKYEIQHIDRKRLKAKQSFDKTRPLILNYTNQKGAKPLCH